MTLLVTSEPGAALRRERHVIVERTHEGYLLTDVDPSGSVARAAAADDAALAASVASLEADRPRWVWDTDEIYPVLLGRGVRIERAHDLRLARAILRRATRTAQHFRDVPADGWDTAADVAPDGALPMFLQASAADAAAELIRQDAAVAAAEQPGTLRLLLAAESAGALAAAEMRHAGLPWDRAQHERILADALGPRVPLGQRPQALEALAETIREALGAPGLNPDSPPDVTRALRSAGIEVESTRAAALRGVDHPVIEPLLNYKKLARLHSANGWHWLDTWVANGRFRPDYVVGGVVTGRWATRGGGGAMQLPKQIRAAVVAEPGWRLVVADAAQLEPRVLAALAGDRSMAAAGRGRDLYDGIVATGAVPDRASAKVGMLGALYGATQGVGGRLVPRLALRFPQALGFVEAAARAGERGESVSTLLGRTTPAVSDEHRRLDRAAGDFDADDAVLRRARALARDRGRFTRNFVVQGTAAEWALCWLAELRKRLWALGDGPFDQRPHLVYFLHDEVIVHAPEALAPAVEAIIRDAATTAGRLLFGDFPIDFPLETAIVERYSDAG